MKLKKRQETGWPLSCLMAGLVLLFMLSLCGRPAFAEEAPLKVMIPVKQTVQVTVGSMSTSEERTQAEKAAAQMEAIYALTAKNEAPLPEGASDGISRLTCTGETEESGFEIVYTAPGEYVYHLRLEQVSAEGADPASGISSTPSSEDVFVVRVYIRRVDGVLLPTVFAYDAEGHKQDLSFTHRWSQDFVPPHEIPGVGGTGTQGFYVLGSLMIALAAGQYVWSRLRRG